METISNEDVRTSVISIEEKIPVFKKLRAKICDNCPLWKAHKEIYGDD